MKRFLLIAMCIFLLCSFPVTAAEEYETAGELYEAWVAGDCVPDYITAIISTDGGTDNLTFGLVEGDAAEAARQEILDLVRDDATVTIMYQTYSRNELYRIQDAIVDEYFGKDLGLVTAGVSEGANKLILEVKTDYEQNADTLAMIREVTERYGEMVSFRFTDSEIQMTIIGIETAVTNPVTAMADPRNPFHLLTFCLILCSMMLAVLGCMEIRRRRLIAATGNGTTVPLETQPVGKKAIEKAIRTAQIQPPASLQERVMRSIRETEEDTL